jgi:phosphotransferase system enzyme I (PtsI)
MNPSVAEYYQSYHPALFRTIGLVAREFRRADKPLCVCGELAADPLAAAVLIGLGVRELSMGISAVASIKKLICALSLEDAEKLARRVQELATAKEVEDYLKTALKKIME